MSRYIDAERLKQFLKPIEWGTPDERWVPEHEIGAVLDYFPAADVVEVVRCRECKHYIEREDGYICANDYLYKDSDWFCADGEKNE